MSVRNTDPGRGTDPGFAGAIARALWFTGPRVAELRTEPLGPPGEGELLVRSIVSLISPGSEMLIYRGEADPGAALALPTSAGGGGYPVKCAYQVVGRVEASGPGATHTAGDVLLVRHPHQDLFVVRDDPGLVFPVPADLPPERAVFANLVDLAVNAVLDVPIRIGDAVVVYGAGVVGSLCAQLAQATAGTVIVIDAAESRRRIALEWGAHAAVDPTEAPAAIREITASRGADVAIEATGTTAGLQAAMESTGIEGTVVAVTFSGSLDVPIPVSPHFYYRRQRLVSAQVNSVGSGLQPRWDFARRMEVGISLLRSERVRVHATHSFPFDRAPEAYELADRHADEVMGITLSY